MGTIKGGELASGYLLAGGSTVLPHLYEFLKKHGVSTEGNPDLYTREYRQFTVDDARELRDRAQTRAVGEHGRVFVVVTPTMTNEAQNALLKVLEEPPAGATVFLIVPSPQALLATLRSRVQILTLGEADKGGSVSIDEFLAASPEKRLDMLKPLYSHDEDEERDVREAVLFLQELERKLGLNIQNESAREGLRAVYRARKYMMDKGSLLKTLLEQVALLVPRV